MSKPETITLTLEDIFGGSYEQQGRIVGRRTKGFDTPGGGWSLFPSVGDKPAKFILWIPKGKRRPRAINVKRVLKGLPGHFLA